MLKSYKYRLYPTVAQRLLLDKHISCCRFVYNLALETKIVAYSGTKTNLHKFDLMRQLTDLKREYTWLNEVSSNSLQAIISNLDIAYTNFYKGGSFPDFKKKHFFNSFKCPFGTKVRDNKIVIPKFKEGISFKNSKYFAGRIINSTIRKMPTGKYFVSILVDTLEVKQESKEIKNTIGIDLGLKTFATLSNGNIFEVPKHLRLALPRLAILQRRASRKKNRSSNRKKANIKVALLHEKIANKRSDFLHKISNQITNDYDTICIEDLNVSGMGKNHCLALSIKDASWSEFIRQLKYKSEWRGNNLIKIGRFEPTSKICSSCGRIKHMPLSERTYNCVCGLSIDRDINAAINIRNSGAGRAGVSVELPTIVGAMKQKGNKASPINSK